MKELQSPAEDENDEKDQEQEGDCSNSNVESFAPSDDKAMSKIDAPSHMGQIIEYNQS